MRITLLIAHLIFTTYFRTRTDFYDVALSFAYSFYRWVYLRHHRRK